MLNSCWIHAGFRRFRFDAVPSLNSLPQIQSADFSALIHRFSAGRVLKSDFLQELFHAQYSRGAVFTLDSCWIHGGLLFSKRRAQTNAVFTTKSAVSVSFSQVMFGRQCFQERCCFRAGFMPDSCEMLLERMGLEFGVGSSEFVVDL